MKRLSVLLSIGHISGTNRQGNRTHLRGDCHNDLSTGLRVGEVGGMCGAFILGSLHLLD